ncbi:hypothetical protein [Streptomyces sp. NPDC054834]
MSGFLAGLCVVLPLSVADSWLWGLSARPETLVDVSGTGSPRALPAGAAPRSVHGAGALRAEVTA